MGSYCPRQHGFIAGRSTVSNLNELMEFLAPEVQRMGQIDLIDVIYFEFRKAFDTVPYDLLLRNLSDFGMSVPMVK